MFTESDLIASFRGLDADHFGGQLFPGTAVAVMHAPNGLDLAEAEDGACKKDGSIIYINPATEHDWKCTLVHEMVHAFEYRFPAQVLPTQEGIAAEASYEQRRRIFDLGPHSAAFFSKLFEIMRARGHDPSRDLHLYFA